MQLEHKAVNHDTWTHIHNISGMLLAVATMLQQRSLTHDRSKLVDPEVRAFAEYTPKLKTTVYGSPEYAGFLKAMEPELKHHYANNSHHPEHYSDGVDGMTLLDVMEMLIDWKASGLRTDSSNPARSIEMNAGRFNLSPQLQRILYNTLALLERPECLNHLMDEEGEALTKFVPVIHLDSQFCIEHSPNVDLNQLLPRFTTGFIKRARPINPLASVIEPEIIEVTQAAEIARIPQRLNFRKDRAYTLRFAGSEWYLAPHHTLWQHIPT